jgi:DNA-binding NarL/FixJ family response regulator
VATNMIGTARLLLVDDHPMFRAGLRVLLERDKRLSVVGEAATASVALQVAEQHSVDVAIVDVILPESGGVALTRSLRTRQPSCKILALSMVEEPVRVADMFRAGASGYALKSQMPEAIVDAIHSVLGGVRYLAPEIPAVEVDALISAPVLPLERLTARERGVFDLLVRGKSNAGVAAILEIAPSTVETHRRNIMHKLEARSIVDLVRVALRHGVMGTA